MRRGKARDQRGVVVVALVAVLLMVGTYVVFSSLNLAAVRVDRDRVTNEALAKAKEALIAYAVSDVNRPGELPCPDVNDDGQLILGEDYGGGGACTSLIGRLPWKTLDLPDLRDDSGERLWYALSADFRAGNSAVALNNDTAYLAGNTSLRVLTAAGLPAAPNGVVVGVVFSVGAALQRADGVVQARGCTVGVNCDATLKCTTAPTSNTPKCNPRNYLDLALGEDNADLLPAANPQFVSAERSGTFNDRLMPIYSDDIMWLVERRASREYAQRLRDHYDAWQNSTVLSGANNGFYPFAATFSDPTSVQAGSNGLLNGTLPLTTAPLSWSNPSFGCTVQAGGTQLDCNTLIVCAFGICLPNLSARINNIGTRFIDPPQAANVQVVAGLSLGGSATWTLNRPQRRLDFAYGGFISAGLIHIVATVPSTSSWLTDPSLAWLSQNNWNQFAFYNVGNGYSLDGAGSCLGGCITVANAPSPNNNKQAVIVMVGRALAGQAARPVTPPAVLTDFLEGANQSPATGLESNLKNSSFNDFPLAVRP